MSITVGDILKVVAILNWVDGDVMQNVFNSVIGGTGGPFTDGDIVDDAEDWVGTMFANLVAGITNDLDGSEVRVYLYDAIDDDWDEVGSTSWTFNPTDAGEYLPRGVASLINCKTTDPDVNGKKYIGGQTEVAQDDGLWGSGHLTNLGLFADDWTDTFTGATSGASWVPGVWSPTNTNFYAMSGTYIIPTIPAYQRRRKRGVGI